MWKNVNVNVYLKNNNIINNTTAEVTPDDPKAEHGKGAAADAVAMTFTYASVR